MSTLNERIKNRRKELGLTQKELADMLSISDKTVSRWESGNQMPDAVIMPELAESLEMNINELYGISNSISPPSFDKPYSNNKPQEKIWLTLTYKIMIIVSIFILSFGTCWLIHCDPLLDVYQPPKSKGMVIFLIGCASLLITEVFYQIIYRDKRIYSPSYLYTDIIYSGFSTIVISFVLLTLFPLFYTFRFTYIYELLSVGLVIVFEFVLLCRKNKLKKLGVSINKKTSIITIIFIVISVVVLFGLFIFFNVFFEKTNTTVAEQLLNMIYGTSIYRIEYLVNICAYFGVSLLLYAMLIINYIELTIKIKKLN